MTAGRMLGTTISLLCGDTGFKSSGPGPPDLLAICIIGEVGTVPENNKFGVDCDGFGIIERRLDSGIVGSSAEPLT